MSYGFRLAFCYRHLLAMVWFQSLSRDSMGSDDLLADHIRALLDGFNPSVGILWVQTIALHAYRNRNNIVSIPQSGFYGFRPEPVKAACTSARGFNPSVGILWVQTEEVSK